MDRRRIQELLEACRPGSGDLSAPEMAEAARALREDPRLQASFEWIERQDRLLTDAFPQVDVPEGLENRLLAALQSPAPAGTALSSVIEPPIERRVERRVEPSSTREADNVRTTRRRSFLGSWLVGTLGTAASLLVLLGWFYSRPPAPTVERIAALALEWTSSMEGREGDWQPIRDADFPHLRWRPVRWQRVPAQLDAEVIAFDFGEGRGRRLLLYQFRTRHTLPLPKIPYESLSVTGAWLSGAWQEGEHVYVAVTTDARLLDSLRGAYVPT